VQDEMADLSAPSAAEGGPPSFSRTANIAG
jgi:hypothetical protein